MKSKIEYILLQMVALKLRWLPLWLAYKTANFLGWFAAVIIGFRRKVALDNLKQAFPEKSDAELHKIYLKCWRHFIKVMTELVRIPRLNMRFINKWINTEQITVLREVLEQGKGAISVSGHFGNWELMGAAISLCGYPVTYVVTSQSNPLVEDFINRMRTSAGIEIIHRKNAIKGVLSALKRNRAVAILCDQDAGEAGVMVPFFNRPASTPRGPALFHLKTGTPVIFCITPREADGKFTIKIERMKFDGMTGDREEDESIIMTEITARLEEEIRRYPEQWLWLHRRWKTLDI